MVVQDPLCAVPPVEVNIILSIVCTYTYLKLLTEKKIYNSLI